MHVPPPGALGPLGAIIARPGPCIASLGIYFRMLPNSPLMPWRCTGCRGMHGGRPLQSLETRLYPGTQSQSLQGPPCQRGGCMLVSQSVCTQALLLSAGCLLVVCALSACCLRLLCKLLPCAANPLGLKPCKCAQIIIGLWPDVF